MGVSLERPTLIYLNDETVQHKAQHSVIKQSKLIARLKKGRTEM